MILNIVIAYMSKLTEPTIPILYINRRRTFKTCHFPNNLWKFTGPSSRREDNQSRFIILKTLDNLDSMNASIEISPIKAQKKESKEKNKSKTFGSWFKKHLTLYNVVLFLALCFFVYYVISSLCKAKGNKSKAPALSKINSSIAGQSSINTPNVTVEPVSLST